MHKKKSKGKGITFKMLGSEKLKFWLIDTRWPHSS